MADDCESARSGGDAVVGGSERPTPNDHSAGSSDAQNGNPNQSPTGGVGGGSAGANSGGLASAGTTGGALPDVDEAAWGNGTGTTDTGVNTGAALGGGGTASLGGASGDDDLDAGASPGQDSGVPDDAGAPPDAAGLSGDAEGPACDAAQADGSTCETRACEVKLREALSTQSVQGPCTTEADLRLICDGQLAGVAFGCARDAAAPLFRAWQLKRCVFAHPALVGASRSCVSRYVEEALCVLEACSGACVDSGEACEICRAAYSAEGLATCTGAQH